MRFLKSKEMALSALMLSLACGGLLLTATGCAGSRYQRSTGTYIDDKALSAKVKTALFRDPVVSGFDVGVSAFRGNVQLTGFVDTGEQKQRAENVAWGVGGVGDVTNNIEIKPPPAMGSPARNQQGESRMTSQPPPEKQPAEQTPQNQHSQSQGAARPGSQSHWSSAGKQTQAMQPQNLQINVENGQATARGIVGTEAQKQTIERELKDIPGVDSVNNQIEVKQENR